MAIDREFIAGGNTGAPREKRRSSHLFLVRLWTDEAGRPSVALETQDEQQRQWQGKVQHVISGQTQYFPDWPALVNALTDMLPAEQIGRREEGE